MQMVYVCAELEAPKTMFGLGSGRKVVGHVTVREEPDESNSDDKRVYLSNLRVDDA